MSENRLTSIAFCGIALIAVLPLLAGCISDTHDSPDTHDSAPDKTVLAAPANLAANPGTATVTLNWTASAGATSYNVKRATTSGGPYTTIAPVVNTTSYTDTTVVNGTTYYYVVSAVNAAGESPDSAEVSATPRPSTQPVAPTGLTAKATGKRKVNLNWKQSTSPSVTQNKIYRSTISGGSYTLIDTIPAAISYNNAGLISGTTYYYVVTAVNSSGLESPVSNQASAMAR